MKKILTMLTIALSSLVMAASAQSPQQMGPNLTPWYATISTGYAWSMKAGITNPDPSFWDGSSQGYDADLQNGSFVGLGFGKTWLSWLSTDVDWTMYRSFHYQKYQTGTQLSTDPGFTGSSRTRYFDMDNDGFLANLKLHLPRDWEWNAGCLSFGVFGGAGVGFGVNQVYNFHTVGYNSTEATAGSTTSIGDPTYNVAFAWQGNVGFSVRPKDSNTTFNFAYRYYDGGRFVCPGTVITNTNSGGGLKATGKSWKGRLKTNQFLVYLKMEL